MGILDAFADPQFRGDLRTGLFDLGKGASRAAGQSVTGLVDLITLGLRPFGYNVQAPIGSTAWAENRGAIPKANYTNQLAGLLGESVGGVAPMVVQAKAPQFAKGLLTLADNAMAPTPINAASRNQAGAIVWHGSPHKFDKFDASKIGTGEGAQAYGHGLYLAESPDVAKSYQTTNVFRAFDIAPEAERRGLQLSPGARGELIRQATANPDPMIATRRLQYANASTRDIPQEKLADLIKGYQDAQKGSLYKVDLPDTAIAKMLDWDKPLSQQPENVRKLFDNSWNHDISGSEAHSYLNQELASLGTSPENRYSQTQVAAWLRKNGVPGIRYLDGGSRGAGVGTSNYVVFPGNEDLLTILERNGIKP